MQKECPKWTKRKTSHDASSKMAMGLQTLHVIRQKCQTLQLVYVLSFLPLRYFVQEVCKVKVG